MARAGALAALGLAALLAGCATNERAEAVYLQQHRAATALTDSILAAEVENPALADRLYDREAALNEVCAPLREASTRHFYDEEIDGDLEWAIVDALDGCAADAAAVERLLWEVDPEAARYYLGDPELASAGD
jgi:uncharacterized lipoprotein YmbA